MSLSYEEIELLMEGLDAIQSNALSSRLLGSLIGAAFSKDEEQREEMLDKMSPNEEQERDQKLLDERIVLLKAELLQMRDKIEVPTADDFKETTDDPD
jgi:hypothetical protein